MRPAPSTDRNRRRHPHWDRRRAPTVARPCAGRVGRNSRGEARGVGCRIHPLPLGHAQAAAAYSVSASHLQLADLCRLTSQMVPAILPFLQRALRAFRVGHEEPCESAIGKPIESQSVIGTRHYRQADR